MWKNVHPEYGAGIRAQDLSNMSRHPYPLDQGCTQLCVSVSVSSPPICTVQVGTIIGHPRLRYAHKPFFQLTSADPLA